MLRFLHVEASSGIVLLLATVVALTLANTRFAESFLAFWKISVGVEVGEFSFRHSLRHLINDGLMTIFFFVVGLEVKRELIVGQLREIRSAMLPLAGAAGGMVVPAALFLMVAPTSARSGWGIPMATDIAFVVGCLAVLGKRVPHGLRITLLTLAIADDVGAILVIAIGYTSAIHLSWLLLCLAGLVVMAGGILSGIRSTGFYLMVGVFTWFACHESGIHATLSGVAIGLLTPVRPPVTDGYSARLMNQMRALITGASPTLHEPQVKEIREHLQSARELASPAEYWIDVLHPWVSFVIMPIFALANAGVLFRVDAITDRLALAVAIGLIVGKPLGILAGCAIVVKIGISQLPDGVRWIHMVGGGALSGIGFTMALFIAGLSVTGQSLDVAKVGVLGGSLISGVIGLVILNWARPRDVSKT